MIFSVLAVKFHTSLISNKFLRFIRRISVSSFYCDLISDFKALLIRARFFSHFFFFLIVSTFQI